VLSEEEALLLTEARTAKWTLEQYEFAYDARIRAINHNRTVLEFLGVLVALLFLFLQYVVKEQEATHAVLGYVGTGLSLAIILMGIWGYMNRWPDQIEKKRDLSREIRDMLGHHKRLSEARPLDEAKLRKWLEICLAFEEQRKHELAVVPLACLQAGYQHVANMYPDCGVKCKKCQREWKPEMNQHLRSWRLWRQKCDACGVTL
jgi:mobilome CxxCx(11)CxxC protein